MHNIIDELILKSVRLTGKALMPGRCNICARLTAFVVRGDNLREDVLCVWCYSFNRSRQIQYVFQNELRNYESTVGNITVWNTESSRSLHERLKRDFKEQYTASEYLGPEVKSGTMVNGVLHEDICAASFPSNHFDFILSSDILEHVPDPKRAFREINRVLKPGGKFIFTVPFMENVSQSDVRARLRGDGTIEYIKEPLYHGDPLRPEGILVYVIFGEDLVQMCQNEGLQARKLKFHKTLYGIIGSNAIVFVASKVIENLSETSSK